MNRLRFGLKAMVAIAVIASILFIAPAIGRFVPTHRIVEPVFCGSCHPEQVVELNATTHLPHFSGAVADVAIANGYKIPAAEAISGGCMMCHNYWENMKWFGITNAAISLLETDNPAPIKDIYGNVVSPYGLASTQDWMFNMSETIEPWQPGLDVYAYTDAGGVNHSRIDYVWSALSALSPGPVAVTRINVSTQAITSCGTAEKGLCHIAEAAVGLSAAGKKQEFPDINQTAHGAGVFFTHEMAYTTAQYAAKPVKLCGACHVFKLPPMKWGGEPWYGDDVKALSNTNPSGAVPNQLPFVGDPFGFTPNYKMTGELKFVRSSETYDVLYRTPDWAHANVPCLRCHAHAGINGESVSSNARTP